MQVRKGWGWVGTGSCPWQLLEPGWISQADCRGHQPSAFPCRTRQLPLCSLWEQLSPGATGHPHTRGMHEARVRLKESQPSAPRQEGFPPELHDAAPVQGTETSSERGQRDRLGTRGCLWLMVTQSCS